VNIFSKKKIEVLLFPAEYIFTLDINGYLTGVHHLIEGHYYF